MFKNKYVIIFSALIVGYLLLFKFSAPSSNKTSYNSGTLVVAQPSPSHSRKLVNVKYRSSIVDLNSSYFEHQPTTSSFVNGLWYDQVNQYLIILLNTTYYHYCGLPVTEWRNFKSAASYGTYYNQRIKSNYDCRRGYVPSY